MAAAQGPSAPRRTSQTRESTAAATRAPAKSAPAADQTRPRKRAKRAAPSIAPVTTMTTETSAAPAKTREKARTWPLKSTTVKVPLVHMRVPVPGAEIAGAANMAQTKQAAAALRSNLPPLDRLLYYGGLATMAVTGVLEWPIAAAAGAGVWVASRAQRRSMPYTPTATSGEAPRR